MAKILILEDDVTLATSWRDTLRLKGHSVQLSWTSSEAIARSEHESFDVCVVDLMLEAPNQRTGDSGQKFLAHLGRASRDTHPGPRVIGVSGFAMQSDPRFARMIFQYFEADAILSKPFGSEELSDLIDELLADPV